MSEEIRIEVDDASDSLRLDVFLAGCQKRCEELSGLSRSRLQQLIAEGSVQVDGRTMKKSSSRVSAGQVVSVSVPEAQPATVKPEDIPLDILYEDSDLAVIDKPAGLTVHPAAGVQSGTLVNALLYHLKDLSGIGGVLRPGIVHRLDKGTSGLMLVAKNDFTHQRLVDAFKHRKVKKRYLALVRGIPKESWGEIDFPLARHRTQRHKMAAVMDRGGEERGRGRRAKTALTSYRVVRRWEGFSLLEVSLHTGRTHQIRVHLSQIGHPVFGDMTYGSNKRRSDRLPAALLLYLDGPALHAWKLKLEHPRTGQTLRFQAPIPERIQSIIDFLDEQEQSQSSTNAEQMEYHAGENQ